VQVFGVFVFLSLLWSFMIRHVFGSCVCQWFTCLLMLVCLLNACVYTAYSFSCIRSRVYLFLIKIFVYLYLCCHLSPKGGDCSDLGPFAPLVRVCFDDK
jgi:hypothetical protein